MLLWTDKCIRNNSAFTLKFTCVKEDLVLFDCIDLIVIQEESIQWRKLYTKP